MEMLLRGITSGVANCTGTAEADTSAAPAPAAVAQASISMMILTRLTPDKPNAFTC